MAENNPNYYLNTPIEDLVANTSNPANNGYLNRIAYNMENGNGFIKRIRKWYISI